MIGRVAHSHFIGGLALSPDGDLLVSCSEDGGIRLWHAEDLSSAGILRSGAPRDEAIAMNRVAFSGDGRHLFVASDDFAIWVFDVAQLRLVATLTGHEGYVRSVRDCGDGVHIISCRHDATIRLWRWRDEECVAVMRDEYDPSAGPIQDVAMVDGQTALTVSVGNRVVQWDLPSGTPTPIFGDDLAKTTFVTETGFLYPPNESGVGNRTPPRGVRVCADGASAGTFNEEVVLWRLDGTAHAAAQIRRIDVGASPVEDVALFVANDREYVACAGATIAIYDHADGASQTVVRSYPNGYKSVVVSHDAQWLFCGTRDGQLERWAIAELIEANLDVGHAAPVQSLCWLDGERCCSGGMDATAILWNNEQPTASLRHDDKFVIVHGEALDRIVVSAGSSPLKLWDPKLQTSIDLVAVDSPNNELTLYSVKEVAALPSNRLLVAGVSAPLAIWDLRPDNPTCELFDGPTPHVLDMALSHDFERALTLAFRKGWGPDAEPSRLHVWDIGARRVIWEVGASVVQGRLRNQSPHPAGRGLVSLSSGERRASHCRRRPQLHRGLHAGNAARRHVRRSARTRHDSLLRGRRRRGPDRPAHRTHARTLPVAVRRHDGLRG
jgi:WD40 repeat protein